MICTVSTIPPRSVIAPSMVAESRSSRVGLTDLAIESECLTLLRLSRKDRSGVDRISGKERVKCSDTIAHRLMRVTPSGGCRQYRQTLDVALCIEERVPPSFVVKPSFSISSMEGLSLRISRVASGAGTVPQWPPFRKRSRTDDGLDVSRKLKPLVPGCGRGHLKANCRSRMYAAEQLAGSCKRSTTNSKLGGALANAIMSELEPLAA